LDIGAGTVNPIERLSRHLIENAETISREITDYNLKQLEMKLPDEIIEQSVKTNTKFLTFLGSTLNDPNEEVADKFIEWHREQQSIQKNYQFSYEEMVNILKPYPQTRLQLINMMTKISVAEGLSTEDAVSVNNRLSYLLDLSIMETMLEREKSAHEMNRRNQKIITELSSPVVPIQKGMAILPLIGEFDFERSEHIMNYVIPKIAELKIKNLIIDFSGIANIDAEIASRIFNVNKVLGLIGIKTMLTGIRPDLAINVINAGLDFSKLNTYGTVQQAILENAE
jgi:rsbT co-antagonist protein RsbR